MEILIGADPELFVRNKTGKYVSAHGLVSGTKKNPLPVEHGAVQVDGMALEFNIDPAKNAEEFSGRIQTVLASLKSMIPGNLTFAFNPVADFGKELIDKQPDEAKELGCDPDFNAYMDGAPNPRPDANTDFRTASGHIHIGWTNGEDVTNPDHLEACMMVTKQLDCVLGVTEFAWCEPNKRKELYGKLGTFRPKHYGVEYRVLSNAWLRSEKLQKLVYTVARNAVYDLYNGTKYYSDNSRWVEDLISPSSSWAWWDSRVRPIARDIWGNTSRHLANVRSDIEDKIFSDKPRTVFLK